MTLRVMEEWRDAEKSNFEEVSYGAPPKVIWLRCGNQPTAVVEKLLRDHAGAIISFELDGTAACWEIY
jgi:predicted nuclease of predicted toxin-antitoxin system